MSLNMVALVGALARDPYTSFAGDGKQQTSCTLKVHEPLASFTLYVPLECYGRSAEQAADLDAEDLVAVDGRLGWKSYVDKHGEKRSTLCVLVRHITVLQPAPAPDGTPGALAVPPDKES